MDLCLRVLRLSGRLERIADMDLDPDSLSPINKTFIAVLDELSRPPTIFKCIGYLDC